ncbi:MAG: BlaI/MecI/CopY family transcriptional regulator, partial [Candidatus Binatia bacterium]
MEESVGGLPHLGELELAIMEFVWGRGAEVTVPAVHRHLGRKRGLAYTTVMTVMSRLFDKGLL